jgi:hypothetical protein
LSAAGGRVILVAMRPLVVTSSLVVLVACTPKPPRADGGERREPQQQDAQADERDYVGKDAQVELAALRFASDGERERFMRARTCLSERGASWEHFPLRKIGNFVEEDWCRGQGAARGCEGGSFREQPDVAWAKVATLHYPQSWPEVFGVQVDLGHNHPGPGWNTQLWVSTNGQTILGNGLHVAFRQGEDWVHLGSGYAYEIGDNHWAVNLADDPWVLLDRLRASPDALLEGIEHWRALERQVAEALAAKQVLKCIYGEYQGNGIPPACEQRVPLDPSEQAEELRKLNAKVARIVELLESQRAAMHTALLDLAPLDCIR